MTLNLLRFRVDDSNNLYRLTQITRTIETFAASTPALPVAGVTYWASRNLRIASTGATVASGKPPVPAAAKAGDFSVTMPKKRPRPSSAAAPAQCHRR